MQLLRVSDRKRGHDNQSLGLAEALSRLTDVALDEFICAGRSAIAAWSHARQRTSGIDLVIGAGHGTHLSLLAMARAARARSVVLMKPSLPRWLFDLCVVPEHDGVAPDSHTMVTLGALNRIRPDSQKDSAQVLILLGGPSRHFGWSDAALAEQLEQIAERGNGPRLVLVASRRTPDSTLVRLGAVAGTVSMPFESTDPDWLSKTLPHASTVWVSEDSVSMAYEAASAGAEVGLLALPPPDSGVPGSRVSRAIDALVDARRATRYRDWIADGQLAAAPTPLAEADRVAQAILERWPHLA